MNNEELEKRFRIFEKQIMQIQEQLGVIEQAILDMNQINLGLDEVKKGKNLEILAPIGRGIFVETKLISEKLTVDVGEGNFIKKSIPETKEIILEQIKKLEEMKKGLENELGKINDEITNEMIKSENDGQVHKHSEKCEECQNKK